MRMALIGVLALTPLLAVVEDTKTETRAFNGVDLVIADTVNGSIDATGQAGGGLQVEVTRTVKAETAERLEAANREVKLDMNQSGGTVKLFVDGPFRSDRHRGHEGYSVRYDFKLRVPAVARVDLYTVNQGGITVSGVTGDFDLSNVNGGIQFTGAGGSGRVHTVNGQVKVSFVRNPRAASSFESLNGNVDLAFQPNLAANVHMETMNGGFYTDFEVGSLPLEPAKAEKRDGRFMFQRRGGAAVKIGPGGPEIHAKTLNGNIFIRKIDKP